eukprot:gene9269-12486_t
MMRSKVSLKHTWVVFITFIYLSNFRFNNAQSNENRLKEFYDKYNLKGTGGSKNGAKQCDDTSKLMPSCTECIPGTKLSSTTNRCDSFIPSSSLIREEILRLTNERFGDKVDKNKPFGLYPYLEGSEFMSRHLTFGKMLSTQPITTLIDIGAYYNPIFLFLANNICPKNIIVIEPILDPLSVHIPCSTITTSNENTFTHIMFLPVTFKYYMDIRSKLPMPETVVCIGCDSHYGPSRKMLETSFERPYSLYIEYPSEYIHNVPFKKMLGDGKGEELALIKKFQPKTNETIYTKRVMKPHFFPISVDRTSTHQSLSLNDFDTYQIAGGLAVIVGGTYGLVTTIQYYRMQYIAASLYGQMPPDSDILEIDAEDGKNVYYIPEKSRYTAIMPVKENDPNKKKVKSQLNEELILKCVGETNKEGMNVSGKVRQRTQEIQTKSMDCVVSYGAIDRATTGGVELLNEVYRMLRPGGLFVFVEPDKDQEFLNKLYKVFPEEIVGGQSAGEKTKQYKQKKAEEMKIAKKGKGGKNSKKALTILEELEEMRKADLEASEKLKETVTPVENDESRLEVIQATVNDGQFSLVSTNSSVVRKTVSYERYVNLFSPFISGVAVRP